MPSKSFFGYTKPAFHYELLSTTLPQPVQIPVPDAITLLLEREMDSTASESIKVGTEVKTGQRLSWNDANGPSVIASVTGTIQSITPYSGDYGRAYTAIAIAPAQTDEMDDGFDAGALDSASLAGWLKGAPGAANLAKLTDDPSPIHTIVVYGGDTDLLVETNLYVLKSRIGAVDAGIKALKAATGIENVVVAVPAESFQNFDGHFHADVKAVPREYPGGQPLMIHYLLTGSMLAQGQTFEDAGICFVRAESVAALGTAVETGAVPVEKILTVLDKNGNRNLVSARIGTPIGAVLSTLNISTQEGDRLIYGGPMTGSAIYSELQPVTPDTDAIMVQDGGDIIKSGDDPCINCGECIRACPTNVPVNLLIRFLEVGQYQEGADLYDLYSCVECGLCSFVCVARIPILQYIKLAKFELARAVPEEDEEEEENE